MKTKLIITESQLRLIKDLIKEDRLDMAQFFGDVTNNVETLLKMFSKYQPNSSWFMSVGYVNNVDLPVNIVPSDELEHIARKLGNPAFTSMVDSEAWSGAKGKVGKTGNPLAYKNPYAGRTEKGEKIPSKVYVTKSFTIQWGNIKNKADKDAEVKSVYDKHGLEWPEGGEIDTNDRRGSGWDQIPGTPFQQHQNTGTKRLAIYSKKEGVKQGKSKYFLNVEGDIAELTPDEVNYLFSLAPKSYEKQMPKRLLDLANQEAAQEIFAVENTYDFKSLDLSKVSYIRCSMQIEGQNKKFSYINKNVVPDGLNSGEFAQFINPE